MSVKHPYSSHLCWFNSPCLLVISPNWLTSWPLQQAGRWQAALALLSAAPTWAVRPNVWKLRGWDLVIQRTASPHWLNEIGVYIYRDTIHIYQVYWGIFHTCMIITPWKMGYQIYHWDRGILSTCFKMRSVTGYWGQQLSLALGCGDTPKSKMWYRATRTSGTCYQPAGYNQHEDRRVTWRSLSLSLSVPPSLPRSLSLSLSLSVLTHIKGDESEFVGLPWKDKRAGYVL